MQELFSLCCTSAGRHGPRPLFPDRRHLGPPRYQSSKDFWTKDPRHNFHPPGSGLGDYPATPSCSSTSGVLAAQVQPQASLSLGFSGSGDDTVSKSKLMDLKPDQKAAVSTEGATRPSADGSSENDSSEGEKQDLDMTPLQKFRRSAHQLGQAVLATKLFSDRMDEAERSPSNSSDPPEQSEDVQLDTRTKEIVNTSPKKKSVRIVSPSDAQESEEVVPVSMPTFCGSEEASFSGHTLTTASEGVGIQRSCSPPAADRVAASPKSHQHQENDSAECSFPPRVDEFLSADSNTAEAPPNQRHSCREQNKGESSFTERIDGTNAGPDHVEETSKDHGQQPEQSSGNHVSTERADGGSSAAPSRGDGSPKRNRHHEQSNDERPSNDRAHDGLSAAPSRGDRSPKHHRHHEQHIGESERGDDCSSATPTRGDGSPKHHHHHEKDSRSGHSLSKPQDSELHRSDLHAHGSHPTSSKDRSSDGHEVGRSNLDSQAAFLSGVFSKYPRGGKGWFHKVQERYFAFVPVKHNGKKSFSRGFFGYWENEAAMKNKEDPKGAIKCQDIHSVRHDLELEAGRAVEFKYQEGEGVAELIVLLEDTAAAEKWCKGVTMFLSAIVKQEKRHHH